MLQCAAWESISLYCHPGNILSDYFILAWTKSSWTSGRKLKFVQFIESENFLVVYFMYHLKLRITIEYTQPDGAAFV